MNYPRQRQDSFEQSRKQDIKDALKYGPLTADAIQKHTGLGKDMVLRTLKKMQRHNTVTTEKHPDDNRKVLYKHE